MLTIRGLGKDYGPFTALHTIDLEVADGQVFGLLGPNGAGKTTLLRVLATLLEPSRGQATVAGFDVLRQPEQVRRHIGVVNGGMGLYDRLTGREILRYFGGFYGLRGAALERRIRELSDLLALEEVLDRRAGEFSTGMKQKVVIARAVLHDPPLLILDEAASGLDILARRGLLEFVQRYRAPGKLVLYSTHVMEEVERVCDRVAIIDHGRLLTEGSLAEVRGPHAYLEDAFFELVKRENAGAN
ncbi:sodium transport system ATP-binding protein [Deinobacterium chartae]|uniref:Sodium transport system ATP-binding protein n=1 Tax=Deinobacterium chartae TaxID=521158 RepID=A0A841HWQ8_9DEIO|nr:ATP-binding cassette domain-containing protein [Deinobacterium chartae]MBB6096640.1 sodium transport system ATP-binding protein [Deinobacterium chartae]